jgi:hypothetical protein
LFVVYYWFSFAVIIVLKELKFVINRASTTYNKK